MSSGMTAVRVKNNNKKKQNKGTFVFWGEEYESWKEEPQKKN